MAFKKGDFVMLMKTFLFTCEVKNRVIKNDLMTYANSLTFKLILAIFPFIIALLTLLGFLNLPIDRITNSLVNDMPKEMADMITYYISDVLSEKRLSLLSSSAIIAVYSASAGFHTMVKGVCNSFEINEDRPFFKTRIIGLVLMVIFVVIIVATLYIVIFGDAINRILENIGIVSYIPPIITGTIMHLLTGCAIIIFLVLLYKFSININIKIKYLIPGIIFTMISWFIISKLFNVYINNFSRYSLIYGSIGAIFVFGIWLFLLSCLILIGSQINAVLYDREFMQKLNRHTNGGIDNGVY